MIENSLPDINNNTFHRNTSHINYRDGINMPPTRHMLNKVETRDMSDFIKNLNKAIHSENEHEDRLSDLPDCVLLHILSFCNTKHAVQTCILSTRWKYLWKRIPTLILHSSEFPTIKSFAAFVSKILTLRDSSASLNALDLDCDGNIQPRLLKKILKYVSSHNSQLHELGVYVRGDSDLILQCVSSCHALTSLQLSVYSKGGYHEKTLFPKSLILPALTSLYLMNFAFCGDESSCVEPFLAFKMLNSLVIQNCEVRNARVFVISSETLVNLSIYNRSLKFTITDKIELSTPSLRTFTYNGSPSQKICEKGRSSITISTLKVVLSSLPDVLEKRCPTLCKLKSLEVNEIHVNRSHRN
ncbi:F-box/RNI superfamily protein [Medicago truncatula]|uniref:F-box/RNI superfamily protein n=1 Tax=Medicago truncatula TaxID=3880 RepID=A0A072UWQ4_MEDTR|nr:F-box/RNI superfamily protein [Medicago truncatula]